MFKCCICPCCYEGCAYGDFSNCCACRFEGISECDPIVRSNCWSDMRVQECCVVATIVFPVSQEKMGGAACGICNQAIIPCTSLVLPLLCFKTCAEPSDEMWGDSSKELCCANSCYCCVSGYSCNFPRCCALRVKSTANCAPFKADEKFGFECSVQQCCSVARYAYPLNPTIPSTIGCCGVVCWTNANHPGTGESQASNPLKSDGEGEDATAVTVQNN